MEYPAPLVSAQWLKEHLGDPNLRVVDCRFSLADPLAGRFAYLAGHVPGAIYLDLETDLSGPVHPDRKGGRHPLPDPATLAETLAQAGIGDETFVVAYDEPPAGGMFAPRLWWLLRWLGHDGVAVLDGGIAAWREAGGDIETAVPAYPKAHFTPRPHPEMVVDAEAVAQRSARTVLIDSRAPARYRGDTEPIDPVAGHIPGAINRDWLETYDPSGRFKSAAAQQERFAGLDGEVIAYCGSGVSASANVLALELAGKKAKLYAGSWSDWVSGGSRPVATGDEL
ncbi:MAG: sulfurtransferase [Meiothermus sp.]